MPRDRPTLEDAIQALRDPACRIHFRDPSLDVTGFQQVNGTAVVNRLQELGAPTPEAALALAQEALAAMKGRDASYWRTSSQIGGGAWQRRPQRVLVFLIPVDQ